MNILVACEYSGRVRDAFRARGHNAISCDLLESESPGPHYQGDVCDLLYSGEWDMMIAHPPCTYLAASGSRWWKERQEEQEQAIAFVKMLYNAPIPRIAIENPVGKLSTAWRQPDQYIDPSHFGHAETKKTGLWLKGLPPLMCSLQCVGALEQRVHNLPASKDRWKIRSRTYPGIAQAMADQWG